jgi:tetratricopeptide (TPR) repeat protein
MKRFTLSFVCLLFVAVPLAPSRAQAQTANSQQTLNQYVVDLQSNPNDTALRGKIIALAQIMRPAPAIPEEARGHYVMATTFAEKAKSDTERARDSSDLKLASAGFERAVAEYKAALLAAPWWADAYKKLAIAQKAASQYDDAIASLNLEQGASHENDAKRNHSYSNYGSLFLLLCPGADGQPAADA